MTTIDPVAAAAAAAAAATAARAAAEAAAAANDPAEAGETATAPTPELASSAGREAALESGATIGSVLDVHEGQLDGILERDASMLGVGDDRASLLGLRDLSGIVASAGLELGDLSLAGPSTGGGDIDRSDLMDAEISYDSISTQTNNAKWRDANGRVIGTSATVDHTARTYDPETGERGTTTWSTETYTDRATGNTTVTHTKDHVQVNVDHFDSTGARISDEDWNRPESRSDDNDPLVTTGLTANDVTVWVDEVFGTNSSGASGSGADAGYRTADDPDGTRAGGGTVGGSLLGSVSGTDVLTGVTGHVGGSVDRLGPQGGSTTVNPGGDGQDAEPTGRLTAVGAMTGYDWVGQGGSPDIDEPLKPVEAPAILAPDVDPNTVNPGREDQSGDAQSSTAYRPSSAVPDETPTDPGESATQVDDFSGPGRGHGADHGHGAGRDHHDDAVDEDANDG
ncbi:MAG TPA: hypothetical protein VM451_04255 [Candidatus Limnocylindria bacterium]|nr:hypothetical protein [Candidatus Limnocylindria bacterium]